MATRKKQDDAERIADLEATVGALAETVDELRVRLDDIECAVDSTKRAARDARRMKGGRQ